MGSVFLKTEYFSLYCWINSCQVDELDSKAVGTLLFIILASIAVSTEIFLEFGTNLPSPSEIKYFRLEELIRALLIATGNVLEVAFCAS
jgi:hypothetical protein